MPVIRNGIRFTGMPGWGEDEDNWKVVLFIRHVPSLKSDDLRRMDEMKAHHREEEPPHEYGPERPKGSRCSG